MTTQVMLDAEVLRREVQQEMLGYPMELVYSMPPQAVESFAGVGNPFSLGTTHAGETVLDVGSGSGFDCFIAAC
jgi:arsenite methyltransferase